jgi:hypothetical protein
MMEGRSEEAEKKGGGQGRMAKGRSEEAEKGGG